MTIEILQGDCLEILPTLPAESVDCCVTSPPYWGLRDYGCEGQLGLEATPEDYVAKLVEVFAAVRRVLRNDGTLWLNLGDCYCTHPHGPRGANTSDPKHREGRAREGNKPNRQHLESLKHKDLVGIPWRVAFALQAGGWYLRQDIIWSKPNPMPESVTDRCTKAHEYIFLLSKSQRYYYDAEAIMEEATSDRPDMAVNGIRTGLAYLQNGPVASNSVKPRKINGGASFGKQNHSVEGTGAQSRTFERPIYEKRNRRSVWTVEDHEAILRWLLDSHPEVAEEFFAARKPDVWTVTTKPYKAAHFATFPPDLIQPCILAGCPEGGTVLDPFLGSGTTAQVAQKNGCNCIGIELNPEYVTLAKQRVKQGMLL
jgi:DNA modification methylase